MENQFNSPTHCRNCEAPIQTFDAFCSNCGQKNTDGRVTFRNLFGEFISANFNLDSRIFRTIRDLFIPGKLTIEYFKGRHKSYLHPVRLFLVTILFLIATQVSYYADTFQIGTTNYETPEIQRQLTQNKILDQFSHLKDSIQNLVAVDSSKVLFDSLENILYRNFEHKKDSMTIGSMGIVLIDSMYYTISKEDYVNLKESELIEKYKVEGYWKRLNFTQQIRTLRNNRGFANFFVKNLVWTMFFMMPFLALLLKLFYRKSKKYYVEHLIFSFHTHAFIFLMFGLTLHAEYWFPIESNWVLWPSFGFMILYVYAAVWNVYQQKLGRTIFKVAIINVLYFFLFLFFLVASVIVGMFLF